MVRLAVLAMHAVTAYFVVVAGFLARSAATSSVSTEVDAQLRDLIWLMAAAAAVIAVLNLSLTMMVFRGYKWAQIVTVVLYGINALVGVLALVAGMGVAGRTASFFSTLLSLMVVTSLTGPVEAREYYNDRGGTAG